MEKAQLNQEILNLQPFLKKLISKFNFLPQEDLLQECNLILPSILEKTPDNIEHYVSTACYNHLIRLQNKHRKEEGKKQRFGNKEEESIPLCESEEEIDSQIDSTLIQDKMKAIFSEEQIKLIIGYCEGNSFEELRIKFGFQFKMEVKRKIDSIFIKLKKELKPNDH